MRVRARASLERAAADGATRLPPALSPICAPAGGGLLLLRRSQSKCKCFCARDANGQSVDRVTLTQGAVAVAVATNALAVPSRPKASPSPTARQATAPGLRCAASLRGVSRPTSAWCSKLRTPADGKFRMLQTPKQHWRTTMASRTPLTRQQRARTSLQHHERTSVFRLIDAPLKPCHQNGIELRRRPSASASRSAPTRR
jgi:hypothetical protein